LRLKILKKLRKASLNSEFTGSYKKSVRHILFEFLLNNTLLKRVLRCQTPTLNPPTPLPPGGYAKIAK